MVPIEKTRFFSISYFMLKRMYIYLTFDFLCFECWNVRLLRTTSILKPVIVCSWSIPTAFIACVQNGLRLFGSLVIGELCCIVFGVSVGDHLQTFRCFVLRGVFSIFRVYFRIKIFKCSFLKTLLSSRWVKYLDNEYCDWAALLGICSLFSALCDEPQVYRKY